jgi:hypothetical protein
MKLNVDVNLLALYPVLALAGRLESSLSKLEHGTESGILQPPLNFTNYFFSLHRTVNKLGIDCWSVCVSAKTLNRMDFELH